MEVAQEEVFGPVAPIIKADDERGAIKIANDSKSRESRRIFINGPSGNGYGK
jgi:acyl-CoA reductase-like NAD-dependent aldehyde dehydrogenase